MSTPGDATDAPTGGRNLMLPARHGGLSGRMTQAVVELVAAIPASAELQSDAPAARAALVAARAAQTAAGISGGAALVPGPLGLLSLLPDIVGVWKVQAQMVADIAAIYGKTATLSTEQMLYCLFRHLFSHGLRDIAVRAGERVLVRRASLQALQTLAAAIGVKVTQRAAGKALARYASLVGAAGVAAYAYVDTRRVARTAIELFGSELVIDVDATVLDR